MPGCMRYLFLVSAFPAVDDGHFALLCAEAAFLAGKQGYTAVSGTSGGTIYRGAWIIQKEAHLKYIFTLVSMILNTFNILCI